MPRIIFKCRYLKNTAAHAENLVTYIATREGVERLPERMRNRPATDKQKFLMSDILEQFPDSTGLFEYEDYLVKPTMENASEFISAALDQNIDQLAHQEVYVNYIATRPRAEQLDSHGLFSDEDVPLVLSQTAQEVAVHAGNIWTPIISLRREDAARLGYDNAAAWMALLRKQRNVFAQQIKIVPENLRWYAAYHDEEHHPHCHMIVYSVDPREGFVTKPAIEAMRSSLTREIFQQDLLQIYTEQTERRKTLTAQSRDTLQDLLRQMQAGNCDNPVLENMLTQLAERLRRTTGKKQFGYLKAPVKKLVNQIVDELAKDGRVSAAYVQWQELRNEVLRTYKDDLPVPVPLSQQKEFKQIKNIIISEAVRLCNQEVVFAGDEYAESLPEEESIIEEATIMNHIESIEEAGSVFLNTDEEGEIKVFELETGAGHNSESSLTEHSNNISPVSALSIVPQKPHIAWNNRYKQALTYLYGTDIAEPDFEQALPLFLLEAEDGNAFAMHDLGRMFTDGLGVEMNTDAAFVWYSKALAAFRAIEAKKEHRYVEYRIGKLYAAGLGTEQDYVEAANWFKEAASKNHKYAQYSLGVLYYRGRGVEHNLNTAFQLYQSSAKQGMPYADYEMAKMYRDGIGTARNTEEAQLHFKAAFHGFQQMERQSRDDKLQYRLGQMLYTGTGTQKDIDKAIYYLEKSARLGNANAQYMLGKIYLDVHCGKFNVEKALRWLTKASDNGNALAQYALGKLYRDGNYMEKNIQRAVDLFTLSAEQDNSYAAYALGTLYLKEEGISKDMAAAVKWLTKSAEQENQYAQYQLGKMYLLGQEVPRDREAAVRWLTLSAEQGNIYAQFFLDNLDSIRNPSMFLATTRLLHHISRIFQEEVKRLSGSPGIQTESKLRRKLREKKIAQGHAPNDHEQKLTIY
ncbi:hypothetical protein BXY41_106266 [Lacrimispora xylanisolvens]|uniref:TPR repeat protein n=1 Tax=Lacrimispora xylanisolvens TaxID=384636 RepID=A0A2S6HSL5_9FIRM|nr:MobP3 family relaxase [Hungatella xylanolytica]PPK80675.1 hypothetical protein BXY41_106266 [Hungatella xylanolytica]